MSFGIQSRLSDLNKQVTGQWSKVIKYIYSSIVIKSNFGVLVFYVSIFFLWYFIFLIPYNSEANTVLFTKYHQKKVWRLLLLERSNEDKALLILKGNVQMT